MYRELLFWVWVLLSCCLSLYLSIFLSLFHTHTVYLHSLCLHSTFIFPVNQLCTLCRIRFCAYSFTPMLTCSCSIYSKVTINMKAPKINLHQRESTPMLFFIHFQCKLGREDRCEIYLHVDLWLHRMWRKFPQAYVNI
mgnify:CR=1 FL=1